MIRTEREELELEIHCCEEAEAYCRSRALMAWCEKHARAWRQMAEKNAEWAAERRTKLESLPINQ